MYVFCSQFFVLSKHLTFEPNHDSTMNLELCKVYMWESIQNWSKNTQAPKQNI
jgi:hypothetical protein